MKKLLVVWLALLIYTIPVDAREMDLYERIEPDRECQIAAGKIWRNRYDLSIGRIEVINNVIFVRTDCSLTKEQEKAIQEMASDYEVSILQNYNRENNTDVQRYIFTAGDQYVRSNGMLLELEHTPYMQDGILMIAWRDYINLYTDVTNKKVQSQWVGGENQEIVFSVISKAGTPPWIYANGVLSIKNNTFSAIIPNRYDGSFTKDATYNLEGKMELKDGVAYYPFSLGNLKKIYRPYIENLGLWVAVDHWNEETKQLSVGLNEF